MEFIDLDDLSRQHVLVPSAVRALTIPNPAGRVVVVVADEAPVRVVERSISRISMSAIELAASTTTSVPGGLVTLIDADGGLWIGSNDLRSWSYSNDYYDADARLARVSPNQRWLVSTGSNGTVVVRRTDTSAP